MLSPTSWRPYYSTTVNLLYPPSSYSLYSSLNRFAPPYWVNFQASFPSSLAYCRFSFMEINCFSFVEMKGDPYRSSYAAIFTKIFSVLERLQSFSSFVEKVGLLYTQLWIWFCLFSWLSLFDLSQCTLAFPAAAQELHGRYYPSDQSEFESFHPFLFRHHQWTTVVFS